MHRPAGWFGTCVLIAAGVTVVSAQNTEWRSYSSDPGSTKYAAVEQIDASNVARLRIAWRRPAVDPQLKALDPAMTSPNNFRATPLMIGGVLYSPNGVGLVEAFDPATGKTLWVQQPAEGTAGLRGDSTRGLGYWRNADEQRLFVQQIGR